MGRVFFSSSSRLAQASSHASLSLNQVDSKRRKTPAMASRFSAEGTQVDSFASIFPHYRFEKYLYEPG